MLKRFVSFLCAFATLILAWLLWAGAPIRNDVAQRVDQIALICGAIAGCCMLFTVRVRRSPMMRSTVTSHEQFGVLLLLLIIFTFGYELFLFINVDLDAGTIVDTSRYKWWVDIFGISRSDIPLSFIKMPIYASALCGLSTIFTLLSIGLVWSNLVAMVRELKK